MPATAHYSPLPTTAPAYSDTYPPRAGYSAGPSKRILTVSFALRAVLASALGLTILHYAILGAFPSTSYAIRFRSAYAAAHSVGVDPVTGLGAQGTFLRDAFPIRSMLGFWDLAEQEVRAKGLDTCGDQLGRGLIDAYHRSQLAYCLPEGTGTAVQLAPAHNAPDPGSVGDTAIWCMPVQRDEFSKWWPYPTAPCLSRNLRTVPDDTRNFRTQGCSVTPDGQALISEMGKERFLGREIDGKAPGQCQSVLDRTALVIGRQDQWNPFHVAEDLVTTLVTVFIMARAAPELVNSRVQLVFAEGFGMDSNHFTPLWDRIGAWAPRRLSLDPWREGECLTNTIHSVGAGASLLSATGIAKSYSCASTITWAASHYYRHLFGLLPTASPTRDSRRAINVLWLSRAKLDDYAQKHDDWSTWRDVRHINNEPALLKRLKAGLRGLCAGDLDCEFEDAQDVPDTWADTSMPNGKLPVRFASIDPTVHTLETQIHYVGHTTIILASHGGALGLSLFLPPGEGTVIELQVEGVKGNWHFQHMAAQMGHSYEQLEISRDVDVEQVWSALERRVYKSTQ